MYVIVLDNLKRSRWILIIFNAPRMVAKSDIRQR